MALLNRKVKENGKHVGKFAGVGAIGAAIDLIILNILIGFGLHIIVANTISASISVSVAYLLQRQWVFDSKQAREAGKFWQFALVTLVGIYVVQNGAILLFSGAAGYIAKLIYDSTLPLPLTGQLLVGTIAKLLAMNVSAVWNFLLYKYFVFR